jgi:anti-anti-sigma factor
LCLGVLTFPIPEFATASRLEGTRAVARFEGELDCAAEGLARAEIEIALERGGSELVIDLSRVEFLDARGVHVLLDARSACLENGRRLTLVPGPEPVRRVLEICGLGTAFAVAEPLAA